MNANSLIGSLKEADAKRPDFPGEHLFVLGAGLLLLIATGRSRSLFKKALIGSAAGALIGRAASGTGGVSRVASLLNGGRGVIGVRR